MGPHPVPSWWQQRTSQLLTPVAPLWELGVGKGRERFLLRGCHHQSPHFPLCSLPLPIWGTSPVRPGPACLPCQIEGSWEISCGSWRLDLDIHHAGSVNTLQIIGSCTTYRLVIKLLPGPAEEIAAGLALCLNYESRYVWFYILAYYIFAVK